MFATSRPEAVVSQTAARELHLRIGGEWRTDLSHFVRGVRWDNRSGGVLLKLRPGAPRILHFKITGVIGDAASQEGYPWASYSSLAYLRQVMSPVVASEARFFLDSGVNSVSWASERTTEFPGIDFRTGALPADFV